MHLICPIAARDLNTLKNNIQWFFEFLPIQEITIIANKELSRNF